MKWNATKQKILTDAIAHMISAREKVCAVNACRTTLKIENFPDVVSRTMWSPIGIGPLKILPGWFPKEGFDFIEFAMFFLI